MISIRSWILEFELKDIVHCESIYLGNNTYKGSLQNTRHRPLKSTKLVIENLCFRWYSLNAVVEIAVLVSHLFAIHRAVADRKSKYAIILEDDFVPPFHFNMSSLEEAAPKGFAMIQLITSYRPVLLANINEYIPKGILFRRREPKTWCMGAYIIDTDRFRPFINSVLQVKDERSVPVLNLFILHQCDFSSSFVFPTICSPYDFAADFTLYHVFHNDTYLSTYPFAESINTKLKNGSASGVQGKTLVDGKNIRTLLIANKYLNQMKQRKVKKPYFAY